MTAFVLSDDLQLWTAPDLKVAAAVSRIANRPGIAEHIGPPGMTFNLTPFVMLEGAVTVLHNDNAALFFQSDYGPWPLCWEGHYLYGTLRGKHAKEFSLLACRLLFDETPAVGIVGLVPVEHRAARAMSRAIGCEPYDTTVDRRGRACIRYLLGRGHGKHHRRNR